MKEERRKRDKGRCRGEMDRDQPHLDHKIMNPSPNWEDPLLQKIPDSFNTTFPSGLSTRMGHTRMEGFRNGKDLSVLGVSVSDDVSKKEQIIRRKDI